MPESPEVAYLANAMHHKFANRTLTSVDIIGGRYKKHGPPSGFQQFTKALPARLLQVTKKGKVLFFEFSNGWTMVSRLGLTGWWYRNNDTPSWRTSTHESLIFNFGTRNKMVYDDQLSYGTIVFCQNNEAEAMKSKIAPDVMDSSTTWPSIKERINKLRSYKLIEDVLVDQESIVSGIGNYLKSEILYGAKIAPMRKVGTLSEEDWKRILHVAKLITRRMRDAIAKDDDDAYEKSMRVYKKKHDPCGNAVRSYMNDSGRTTYWVPELQK